MIVVEPCDRIAGDSEIVVQMSGDELSAGTVFADHILAAVVAHFVTRVDTEAERGVRRKAVADIFKVIFTFCVLKCYCNTARCGVVEKA